MSDVRLGVRTAALASYTTGTLLLFNRKVQTLSPGDEERLILKTMHNYGRRMCHVFGIGLRTEGVPTGSPVAGTDSAGKGRLFIVNHRSGLDILISLATLAGRFVSRGDVANWPVLGPIARRAGMLFVDREDRRSAAKVMKQMIDSLDHGRGVVIFPEGTTYAGDEVRPLKPGAFSVARRTGCELVPVGIAYDGPEFAVEEPSFANHMRKVGGKRRVVAGLAVGQPFRAEGRDNQVLADLAQQAIAAEVKRARELLR